MTGRSRWDEIYETKGDRTSWFRPTLDRSLAIVDRLGLPPGGSAIDVGAGTSTLVEDLLTRGFADVTIADLSQVALDTVRERLGARASRVEFLAGDITTVKLPANAYDLWHDRAVFHFLTDPDARRAYVRQVLHAVKPGGHIVVATFGPEGPEQCSGLPVVRYGAEDLHATFGTTDFDRLGHERDVHETPWGTEQEFVYCYCRCTSC